MAAVHYAYPVSYNNAVGGILHDTIIWKRAFDHPHYRSCSIHDRKIDNPKARNKQRKHDMKRFLFSY